MILKLLEYWLICNYNFISKYFNICLNYKYICNEENYLN